MAFIRALIPFMKTPPSLSNYLPITPYSNTITLGVRFQHMSGGQGATNMQTVAPPVTGIAVCLFLAVEVVGEFLEQLHLEPHPQWPSPLPSPPALLGPFSCSQVSGSPASVSFLHYSWTLALGVGETALLWVPPLCITAFSSLLQMMINHSLFFIPHMALLVCLIFFFCLLSCFTFVSFPFLFFFLRASPDFHFMMWVFNTLSIILKSKMSQKQISLLIGWLVDFFLLSSKTLLT